MVACPAACHCRSVMSACRPSCCCCALRTGLMSGWLACSAQRVAVPPVTEVAKFTPFDWPRPGAENCAPRISFSLVARPADAVNATPGRHSAAAWSRCGCAVPCAARATASSRSFCCAACQACSRSVAQAAGVAQAATKRRGRNRWCMVLSPTGQQGLQPAHKICAVPGPARTRHAVAFTARVLNSSKAAVALAAYISDGPPPM